MKELKKQLPDYLNIMPRKWILSCMVMVLQPFGKHFYAISVLKGIKINKNRIILNLNDVF